MAASGCGQCGGPVVTVRGSPRVPQWPGPLSAALGRGPRPGARGRSRLVSFARKTEAPWAGRAPPSPRRAPPGGRHEPIRSHLDSAALALAAEDESAPKVPLAAAVRSNPDPQRASSLTRSFPTALPQCPWHASVQCPRPVKSTNPLSSFTLEPVPNLRCGTGQCSGRCSHGNGQRSWMRSGRRCPSS